MESFDARWGYGHAPFAAAAYVVDPEFRLHDHCNNEEVMEGFLDTVEKIGILLEARKMEATFTGLWQQRKEFLVADPKAHKEWTHYPNYPSRDSPGVQQFCQQVNAQLLVYRNGQGTFARSWLLSTAEAMPAHLWCALVFALADASHLLFRS